MKKAIAIIVFGLLWCNTSFAISQQSAIEDYLSDHKLENIEGLWIGPTGRIIVVYISGDSNPTYVGRVIRGDNHMPEGSFEWITLEKGSGRLFYGTTGCAVSWPDGRHKYDCDLTMEVAKNEFRRTFTVPAGSRNCNGCEPPGQTIWSRVWPEDIDSHNAKLGGEEKPTQSGSDDGKIIIIGKGSGFFISDKGHIASNAHVIGVCKKVMAYEGGEEITLKILATDMVNDIGLVKGKFKNKQYLNIKTDGAELGEQIIVFGYPLSQDLSDSVKLTQGIVSALSGPDNNYSEIQIDAAIQPGNSGGPVINMNGQVVGIASAGLSKLYMLQKDEYIPENVNFAVAAQSLTTFLKANKMKVTSGPTRIYSTKELAKIGEPATIQLTCMNTMAEYEKLKKANKHSDVLLD